MKLFDVLKILTLKVKRRPKKNPAFLKLKIEAESLYIYYNNKPTFPNSHIYTSSVKSL